MKQLTIHQFKQTVAALALVLVSTASLAQATRMLYNMNDRMEYLDVESSDDQIVVSGLDKSDSTIYKNAFYQHNSFLEDALDAYQMLTKDFSGIVGTEMPDMRFIPALSKESAKNTNK